MEHPGVARAQASIDAFNAGDMTALSDFYADDVVWQVAGRHGLSGDYTGRADLMGTSSGCGSRPAALCGSSPKRSSRATSTRRCTSA